MPFVLSDIGVSNTFNTPSGLLRTEFSPLKHFIYVRFRYITFNPLLELLNVGQKSL